MGTTGAVQQEYLFMEDNLESQIGVQAFTPEDLLFMSLDDTEEDMKEIKVLQDALLSLGFCGAEDLNYEQLTSLYQRAEVFENEQAGIINFLTDIEDNLKKELELFKSSKASLQFSHYQDNLNKLRIATFTMPKGFNKDLQMCALNIVSAMLESEEAVEINAVYLAMLKSGSLPASIISFKQKDILQYLETLIPTLTKAFQYAKKDNNLLAEQRRVSAEQLFRKEVLAIDELNSLGVERLSFIRQVKHCGENKYKIVCSGCGRSILLQESMLSIIIFPTESGSEKSIFPKAAVCSCGRGFIFTPQDYLEILRFFLHSNRININNFLQCSTNFCKGASFVRVEPSLQLLEDTLEYMITHELQEGDTSPEEYTETLAQLPTNDIAFLDAVKRFYVKLTGYEVKENIGSSMSFESTVGSHGVITQNTMGDADTGIEFAELACYFCSCLGKNYKSTKNKALYSLLSKLSNSAQLEGYLNATKIWSLKNHLTLIQRNQGSLNTVTHEEFLELLSLNQYLGGSVFEQLDTVENRERLHRSLQEKRDVLADKILYLERKREELLQSLSRDYFALSFCKILNLSNYKMANLDAFVCDPVSLNLFNYIADRMIITNYAGEFFDYWINLHLVNKSSVISSLTEKTGMLEIRKIICREVERLFDKTGISHNGVCSTYDWLEMCFAMSAEVHKPLQNLYLEYENGNFYRFCQNYLKIPIDTSIFFGQEYSQRFADFLEVFAKEAQIVCSVQEYQFYLKDFTLEELDEVDKQYQIEDMIFGRYVPKRLQGENFSMYYERFMRFKQKDATHVEVYDTLEYFEAVFPWLAEIATCSLLYEMEYTSYTSSAFMVSLVLILQKMCSRESVSTLLGISKSHLNIIKSSVTPMKLDSQHSLVAEDTYRLLNGIYFTSAASYLANLLNKYEKVILPLSISWSDRISKFDIYRELKVLKEQDYLAYDDEGDPVDDMEEALEEMLLYVKSPELRDVLGG